MSGDIEIAETAAELAKSSGLKNYLWMYFLIVPLAASTASAVAIIIAALQGLSAHELAPQIYAKTLIIGFKTVGIIGVAYISGLLLALGSAFLLSNSKYGLESRLQKSRQELASYIRAHKDENDDEIPGDLGEYQFLLDQQVRFLAIRQKFLVSAAVIYSFLLMIGAVYWFLRVDVQDVWEIVSSIADGTGTSMHIVEDAAKATSLEVDE